MGSRKRVMIITGTILLSLACSFPLQLAVMAPSPEPNYQATTIAQAVILTEVAVVEPGKGSEAEASPQTALPPPAATNTVVVPTATLNLPQRPGGSYAAAKLTPVVDGNLEEWDTNVYQCGYIIFGAGYWGGPSDLGCTFQVTWDEQNLFLGVTVQDQTYAQRSSGQYLYLGDSVEIQLDANLNGDFYYNSLDNDDYQLGLSPGSVNTNGFKEAVLYYPDMIKGSRPQIGIASIKTADGYRLESAIPWSVFGISPASGNRYGFALSVSDNDAYSGNYQQSMVSGTAGRKLLNPTTWSQLQLTN